MSTQLIMSVNVLRYQAAAHNAICHMCVHAQPVPSGMRQTRRQPRQHTNPSLTSCSHDENASSALACCICRQSLHGYTIHPATRRSVPHTYAEISSGRCRQHQHVRHTGCYNSVMTATRVHFTTTLQALPPPFLFRCHQNLFPPTAHWQQHRQRARLLPVHQLSVDCDACCAHTLLRPPMS